MASWSRDQSQSANHRAIKSTTSPQSKAMGNLQAFSEAQKRASRRAKGIQMPFARAIGPIEIVKPKNDREYRAPVKAGFIPAKPRGRGGCRMNNAHRKMAAARHAAREAFFAE